MYYLQPSWLVDDLLDIPEAAERSMRATQNGLEGVDLFDEADEGIGGFFPAVDGVVGEDEALANVEEFEGLGFESALDGFYEAGGERVIIVEACADEVREAGEERGDGVLSRTLTEPVVNEDGPESRELSGIASNARSEVGGKPDIKEAEPLKVLAGLGANRREAEAIEKSEALFEPLPVVAGAAGNLHAKAREQDVNEPPA